MRPLPADDGRAHDYVEGAVMADDWLERRRLRVTDPARTPFAIERDEGSRIVYVRGEFLVDPADAAAVDLTGADYELLLTPDTGWLEGLGLALYRYLGSEPLHQHVASLRAQAMAAGVATPRIDLHYVLTGEPKAGVPRGGPADAPTDPTAAPVATWADPVPPAVAVLDTGLALQSIGAQAPAGVGATRVAYRDPEDVDTLHPLLPNGQPAATLDVEAGHGTFITALINRMTGGAVRVATLKVLEPDGVGSEESVVLALKHLRRLFPEPTVEVVNLSLGGFTDDGGWASPADRAALFPAGLRDRMPLALGAELAVWAQKYPATVFVACAGNESEDERPFWPAAAARESWATDPPTAPVVIAVASLTSALTRSAFSNIGDWVTVSTLGENILSEFPDGDYPVAENLNRSFGVGGAHWDGTSFATPLVAAEILRIAALDVRAGRVEPGGALAAARSFLAGLVPATDRGCGLVYDPRVQGPMIDPTAG